jgi:hypothetical protein
VELRSAIRYRITAPVVFTWPGLGDHRVQGEGVTRDVSKSGAFVLTPSCPPPGAAVRMEIWLFRFRSAGRPVTLVADARVVRVEHPALGEQVGGFAVVSEGFELPSY